jgi:RES domain-containing protein
VNLTAWRIVQSRWASTAFDGEGARRSGGRWNSPGRPLVYVSEHAALAALEMLVHLGSAGLLKSQYVLFEVAFAAELVDEAENLPKEWADDPAPASAQQFGDEWLARPTARPILRVPSAVVRTGFNYLLNPLHADFKKIHIGKQQPFDFDPRLVKK